MANQKETTDVLGTIFEGLIPLDERHKLGQYFTRADVVDLILRFCLTEVGQIVLDPACGVGTFLKRAYRHQRVRDARLSHEELLATLWGVDIAKFAAHLATINLAIDDLGSQENYPHIIHNDFFDLRPATLNFPLPRAKEWVPGVSSTPREIERPDHVDCVVGNPPYTRQEWMEDLIGDEGYKEGLIRRATTDANGTPIADVSKRSGIHVYFFLHGAKFLAEGGRFGFVVPNSWLDVDYGAGLQDFFLRHFKIVTIVESKVERWFPDADINTCIVVLEKCGDAGMREENLVRFVRLRRKLAELIPTVSGRLQEEAERLHQIDLLIEHVMTKHQRYRDDDLRVNPVLQRELWAEGYNVETDRYEGAKWGKYLRAPDVYFDVLEKCGQWITPLSALADVRYPLKTGANAFFYLDQNQIGRWEIESEFLVPVLKSPRDCPSVVICHEHAAVQALMVHREKQNLDGTNILKYIEWGESEGYHQRPTCAARDRWYDLGELMPADLLFPRFFYQHHRFWLNEAQCVEDQTFYGVLLHPPYKRLAKALAAVLNSTLGLLLAEISGRFNLGEGVVQYAVYEAAAMPVPNVSLFSEKDVTALEQAFDRLSTRSILTVFDEVKCSDRRALDMIVFDVVCLSETEREAVYEALVELVRARIERAESVQRAKKSRRGVDVQYPPRLLPGDHPRQEGAATDHPAGMEHRRYCVAGGRWSVSLR